VLVVDECLIMKIAVFTKNKVNPAYGAARIGAERVAARLGAVVVHYVPEIADDAAQQAELFERALHEKADAMVVSPVHRTKLATALSRIKAAGVPMVGFISQLDDPPWLSFVRSDDRKLAKELASTVCRKLSGNGEVVIIDGSFNSQTSLDRSMGFKDAVNAFPGIRIVAVRNGRYDFEIARQEMNALLDDIPHFDAVIAANDVMALGALSAMEKTGRTVLVAGVNAIPDAINAIQKGSMVASADYNAMNLAAIATECAIRHLRGESIPGEVVLPVQIVDRSNVALWAGPYESRPQIGWDEMIASQFPSA
jgi:ribose transport system substrate-binding protein